ncbi:nuclear transport factor 2 family protein [Salinimicrobium sp. TH3]|uniref:nuclear transport factor 2 family protein n=1 Tax=Salinimicrobium sp. TH3 TaxID=2997342 RepID=UPI002274BBBB|nr:hypothetical protein [Salinimicrobium sp. TH3]MCY2686401.1 hypothetical protein [Salinimicrobium sp. TH3]
MRRISFCAVVLLLFYFSCNNKNSEAEEPVVSEFESNYEVASEKFSEMNEKAMTHLANFEFDEWSNMLADDVEYYFPDGDADRTIIKGKEEVVNWWKNWRKTSGIDSMEFVDLVTIPVKANQELNYSGLTGVITITYFSNHMNFNGQPVNIRSNSASHFNQDSLIDRIYTYYDRTPIIETVDNNILEIIVKNE